MKRYINFIFFTFMAMYLKVTCMDEFGENMMKNKYEQRTCKPCPVVQQPVHPRLKKALQKKESSSKENIFKKVLEPTEKDFHQSR